LDIFINTEREREKERERERKREREREIYIERTGSTSGFVHDAEWE
jgi:hypothetical protein